MGDLPGGFAVKTLVEPIFALQAYYTAARALSAGMEPIAISI